MSMKKVDKNSKERILKAAVKLFAEKGYEGTSIREICKTAKSNICMISYYWGGKKELYQGIIDDLLSRLKEYAQSFIDFKVNPNTLDKKEQINLLITILDKFIAFFYSENISKDMIIFLLKEQQNPDFTVNSETFKYLRTLVGAVFNKNENDKEIIFRTLFIISQINSPRILPSFSLKLLRQDDFVEEDIKIIKENLKFYINSLLKEEKIV